MFRKDDRWEFYKHQQTNLGESDSKQLQLRNQTVVAAADFPKDENLQTIVTSPLSRDSDEQLKHVQKAITIADIYKKNINATMKYYSGKPENAHV